MAWTEPTRRWICGRGSHTGTPLGPGFRTVTTPAVGGIRQRNVSRAGVQDRREHTPVKYEMAYYADQHY